MADLQSPTQWSRHLECILSLVGYAVGLSNFWRFPYLCMKNGGGAFMIPYFFFLITAGIPLFFLELSLGQFTSLSPISVWDVAPFFKGIGASMCLVSYICAFYYITLINWALYYFYNSLTTGELPWTTCDNWWNTDNCQRRTYAADNTTSSMTGAPSILGSDQNETSPTYNNTLLNGTMTPAEEYFQYKVLGLSPGIETLGGLQWPLVVCHLITWTMITLCLVKGVRSVGKVVYVTAIFPYIFLIILLIRGLTLEGSLNGILYYIRPDLSRLGDLQMWAEACIQIFFSLGPGWGTLIVMSSHNKFNNNVIRDTMIVPFMNCGTSVFAGFVVFSIVGFMAHEAGTTVDNVIQSGVGLAFIVYPEALSLLPAPPFWSALFFLMLIMLGLDTEFTMVETMIGCICDRFKVKKRRWLVLILVNIVGCIVGLVFCTQGGVYIFQIIDWYSSALVLMTIGALEPLVISWFYGYNNIGKDIEMMTGKDPWKIVKFQWAVFIPILMTLSLIYSLLKFQSPTYGDYVYPNWIGALGWSVSAISVLPIIYYGVKEVVKSRGTLKERFCQLFKPTPNWGPRDPEHRLKYEARFQKTGNICSDDDKEAAGQMLQFVDA